ncbi:UDP-glucuronate 4-epimerase [Mariprofundus ferrinatatus]|uniref:UDP-glucuronate 4-epimerase n=1 Tax=Mariprofundus ferrinatatus TaxID=1921087 RepID=A0A2K8LAP4_9PROT|nr:NAD-dependent epimerase [Mariprofundus ferrinatatus]ATX81326.1 UDP-glucuronate 4-epimerase [Mariprofundus ferrinatatus]
MTAPLLVTGAAGFIGMHVCEQLLNRGLQVIGIDNLNDYYDVSLKEARLARLKKHKGFRFFLIDISDRDAVANLFKTEKPSRVIHLAAQAGVRYSLEHPHAYADSNLTGFVNILEGCRAVDAEHLVFASSSSVYGSNKKLPYSESDPVDHPISLYAATKKANELMAHSYAHLYGFPCTGLRFFTVYGPWGRPDMAYFGFTRAILAGETIKIFNHGDMQRDFTYIDDIVDGVLKVFDNPPEADEAGPAYRIYNIGNDHPERLGYFVETLENVLGVEAIKEMYPMQPGDVQSTHADLTKIRRDFGFSPTTSIEEGLKKFADWYRGYYKC